MKFLLMKDQEILEKPLTILLEERGHSYGESGICITPEFTEESSLRVEREGNAVTIRCREKAHFFRGIGQILMHLGEDPFQKEETVFMDHLGVMPDCSRNGVLNINMLKKVIRKMAFLGMNELFLYTEDTYELPEYPYFGAFRGRYSKAELKECDAYGALFGVALVPCIQTLAHLKTFLIWADSAGLRDNIDNLLPEEEKVYQLIDTMLKNLSECISGRKIHLGMDEAFNLGLGVYLKKHGFTNRLSIMKHHLAKVEELAQKYGLEPMIWSDMYFNLASEDGTYYNVPRDYEWDEKEKPDRNLTMVYWDYYHHDAQTYERMLHLHKKLSDKVYFAGGGWTWNGVAPNYGRALDSTRTAMGVMKEQKVRSGFMTFWMDDGAETPFTTGLLPMIYFAEEGFCQEPDDSTVDEILRFFQKAGMEDWMLFSQLDCLPGTDPVNAKSVNPSKELLYQDPLLGLFDAQYQGHDLYGHYGKLAKKLREVEERNTACRELFACYRSLAELLAVKGSIGMDIRRAYREGDRDWLTSIAEEQIPVCLEELEQYHEYREKVWFTECKPNGYEVLDIRLGGLRARLISTQNRISDYLEGRIEEIPELLEERIPYCRNREEEIQEPTGCNTWAQIVSAGNI